MKLQIIDGQPFIRQGARTFTPVEAVWFYKARVSEAKDNVTFAESEKSLKAFSQKYALEHGEKFDRNELKLADTEIAKAKGQLEVAESQLACCRALVTDHYCRHRMDAARADIDTLLTSYPVT